MKEIIDRERNTQSHEVSCAALQGRILKDNKKSYPINYLGKTYNTTIHKDLTDEEFEQVRKEYYTKPDFKEVQDQFLKLQSGGMKN